MVDKKACEKRDVTLVLSSGAALGLAHIGTIAVLEKCFNIKAIIGTSMGAIVGGLYACGFSPNDMVDLVKDINAIDYIGLLKIGLPGKALLDTKWLERYLLKHTDNKKIEDLEMPYAAIAFDINNSHSVVMRKGPIGSAMAASSCVPFMFEPFKTGNHILFDGAVEYPLPINFAKIFSKYRPIVAVSCLPEIKENAEEITVTNFDRSIDLDESYIRKSFKLGSYTQAAQALSQALYHKPFLYVNNYAKNLKEWELDKVESFYNIGKNAAEKAIEKNEEDANIFDYLREKFEDFMQLHF
ncbi:MAG: patatin-like phospholipase family protein [Candidatus Zixiibacteriota bacterium]